VDIYHPAKFHPDRIRGCASAHARFRASNCLLGYLFVILGFFISSTAKTTTRILTRNTSKDAVPHTTSYSNLIETIWGISYRLRDIIAYFPKIRSRESDHAHFYGQFVVRGLGLAMINMYTKFEVSSYIDDIQNLIHHHHQSSSSFICLREPQKNIQTSRSTKAKYALSGVLIKDCSTIHANF